MWPWLARAAKDATEQLLRAGESPGHGDLGTVDDDGVGMPKAGAQEAEREGGVEHEDRQHLVGVVAGGEQGGRVGQPQVTAQPEDGGGHADGR